MKIHTYFEELPEFPHDKALVELWASSWRRHGWEPVVLGPDACAGHPHARDILESDWLRNTVNPWSYAAACYRRWMSYACSQSQLVVASDYDVMNYGWTPDDCLNNMGHWWLTIYDAGAVPCAMAGSPFAYEQIVRACRNVARLRAAGPLCVGDDLNEMNILRDFCRPFIHTRDVVRMYPDPGWRTAPLVHYKNDSTPNPRVDSIRRLRAP